MCPRALIGFVQLLWTLGLCDKLNTTTEQRWTCETSQSDITRLLYIDVTGGRLNIDRVMDPEMNFYEQELLLLEILTLSLVLMLLFPTKQVLHLGNLRK